MTRSSRRIGLAPSVSCTSLSAKSATASSVSSMVKVPLFSRSPAHHHFPAGEKKDLEFQGLFLRWCPEGDSNSHSFRKRILNPPRLPIPPSGLNGGEVYR